MIEECRVKLNKEVIDEVREFKTYAKMVLWRVKLRRAVQCNRASRELRSNTKDRNINQEVKTRSEK